MCVTHKMREIFVICVVLCSLNRKKRIFTACGKMVISSLVFLSVFFYSKSWILVIFLTPF